MHEEAAVHFPSGKLTLEGVLHRPGGRPPQAGVVVCHPHPLRGGDMENLVVVALCRRLADDGMAALRFNFRGTGGSEGAHDGGRGEREDVIAAVTALASACTGAALGLAGYSFGAAMALEAASRTPVRALALVSVPAAAATATSLPVPTLLVTGQDDQIAPPGRLRPFCERFPGVCRFVEVPGADHFWTRGLGQLCEQVARFFADTLLKGPAPY
jgi:hypothetical protein